MAAAAGTEYLAGGRSGIEGGRGLAGARLYRTAAGLGHPVKPGGDGSMRSLPEKTVIARLDRATQYAGASMIERGRPGILGHPVKPGGDGSMRSIPEKVRHRPT